MFALDVYMAAVYPAGPDPMIRQLTFSIDGVFILYNLKAAKIKVNS
jgi:hypothetical protein